MSNTIKGAYYYQTNRSRHILTIEDNSLFIFDSIFNLINTELSYIAYKMSFYTQISSIKDLLSTSMYSFIHDFKLITKE